MLTRFIIPNSAAAFATAIPPSGVSVCSDPIGASRQGIRSWWPKNVVPGFISRTSRRIRGRRARASRQFRLRLSVVSVSAAPVT